MSAEATPTVVVMLTAEDSDRWPLIEDVRARTELHVASSAETFRAILPAADVALVTDFRRTLLRDAWPGATRLKWVHATSAGVDTVTFPELGDSGVTVTNARGVFDPYIAEYVLGCVLVFAKGFLRNITHQRAHSWHYHESRPVAGRRLLVYGAGSVGGAVARLAHAAGMAVTGIARRPRAQDPGFETVRGDDALTEELARADYVVITAPLTDVTFHRFDAGVLASMRDDAVLINVGRGGIVDTHALVDALRRNTIRGAALDVFEEEPLPPDHPFWALDNVLLSAHQAGDIEGWRDLVMRGFLENLDRWLAGAPLTNVVATGTSPTGGAQDPP